MVSISRSGRDTENHENNQEILEGVLRMRKIIAWSMLFGMLILAGCAAQATPTTAPLRSGMLSSGIQLNELSSGISVAKGNPNEQVVTYHVVLFNPGPNPVTLTWLEPVLKDPISTKTGHQDLRVLVNQSIPPNAPLVIDGSFSFDSSGMSKAEIAALGMPFNAVNISSEQTLSLNIQ
jgi:hypothetical protein